MLKPDDIDYYRHRERVSRQQASEAIDPAAAAAHNAMADRYALLLAPKADGGRRPRLGPRY